MVPAARVVVWAARGNRTVDVRMLRGPRQGRFEPPPYLAGHASRGEYDLSDRSERDAAYELLLCHGTAEDITGWVNAGMLAGSLDALGLAPHVAGPWRRALRDLGLLPSDEPTDEPDGGRDRAAGHPGGDGADGDRGDSADFRGSGGRRGPARPRRPGPNDPDLTGGTRPTAPAA
ncbi:MAG TPA: hypothetical protein VFX70_18600 [Mycobacteriales bacterium]|nr:hypothetical protein [Mycobacteriales bacterium]